jgi:RNA polymerase subunit RPABC4/transcription elongation factor Spt4
MDLEQILSTLQPFLVLFVALTAAFLTAVWVSVVIWAFRDIRSRTRDIFAQILATLMVLLFFPLFPLPGLILYLFLRPRETLSEIYERKLEEETLLQGIQERMACPGCNRRIEEDYIVCPACQTRLKKACQSCERLLHLHWTICPYCGAPQTGGPAVPELQPLPRAVAWEAAVTPRLSSSARSSLPEPIREREPEGEPVWNHEGEPQARIESGFEREPWNEEAEERDSSMAAPAVAQDQDSAIEQEVASAGDTQPEAEIVPAREFGAEAVIELEDEDGEPEAR